MPRTKTIVRKIGNAGVCEELVRETFTHIMVTEYGRILWDGVDLWDNNGMIYYGPAPHAWNANQAVKLDPPITREYIIEVDYS